MSTEAKTKQGRAPRKKPEAQHRDLITHREIAARCSITTETLRDWVAKGLWPRPHSIIAVTWLYKAELVEHWFATGEWREDAKFMTGEGRGRDPKGEGRSPA